MRQVVRLKADPLGRFACTVNWLVDFDLPTQRRWLSFHRKKGPHTVPMGTEHATVRLDEQHSVTGSLTMLTFHSVDPQSGITETWEVPGTQRNWKKWCDWNAVVVSPREEGKEDLKLAIVSIEEKLFCVDLARRQLVWSKDNRKGCFSVHGSHVVCEQPSPLHFDQKRVFTCWNDSGNKRQLLCANSSAHGWFGDKLLIQDECSGKLLIFSDHS